MQPCGQNWRTFAAAAAFAVPCAVASAANFNIVDLVSDDAAAHPAQLTDASLVNGWGLSYSATGPFWVSDNGTGKATVYTVNPTTQVVTKSALVVTVPGDGSVTGQVFNSNTAGGAFNADNFLFVSEDGTVAGWRGALGTTAEVLASGSSANVYKGSAFATIAGSSYLYAANFRQGTIDVLKGTVAAPALTGSFSDPSLPTGYAPFNVQLLGGSLYVTYAVQDATAHDEVAGAGLGLVDRYDLQGNLLGRIAAGGTLNAPWGLAIAPSSFGAMAGALLVGNFGNGRISAYDLANGNAFLGQVLGADGLPLAIDGLWALTPGNNGSSGSSSLLYFAAGPDGEGHGLFGVLTPVPEVGTAGLMGLGLLGMLGLVGVRTVARRPGH